MAEGARLFSMRTLLYIYTTSINLFYGDSALPPSSLMFLVFNSFLIGQIHRDGIVYCLGARDDVTVNTRISHF